MDTNNFADSNAPSSGLGTGTLYATGNYVPLPSRLRRHNLPLSGLVVAVQVLEIPYALNAGIAAAGLFARWGRLWTFLTHTSSESTTVP